MARSDGEMYKHHDTFTLVTVNPAFGEGLKGIRVLQQMVPFRTSTVGVSETTIMSGVGREGGGAMGFFVSL